MRLSDAAFRLWSTSIDYAREQLTGGEIEAIDIDALPRAPTGKRRDDAVAELESVELWEKLEEGAWQIHDFHDWQDSPEKVKQKKADARERMRRVRGTGSLDVRANEQANAERTSPEVLLTDPSLPISGSGSLGPNSPAFKRSPGSSRSPARGLAKAAKSEHVPAVIRPDWLPAAAHLAALATKYSVPEARISAQVPEFIWFWTSGKGAGSRKTDRGWAAAFGNCIEMVAKRGALYTGAAGVPAAPDQAAEAARRASAKAAEQRAEAERDKRRAEAQRASQGGS